ncbi:hypothetical protein [Nonomuraea sp. KM90]|uniref:hypothetical protein n=1 Tax=Nonomuraea sp. KM90 TaxID=3457428 RepID=UPI003FCD7CA7
MDRLLMTPPMAVTTPAPQATSADHIVAALRDKAAHVNDNELARLTARIRLDAATLAEITATVNRVTDTLLEHACTRISTHAGTPAGERYVTAARELFALPADSGQRSGNGWPQ